MGKFLDSWLRVSLGEPTSQGKSDTTERVAAAIARIVEDRTSGDYDIHGEIATACARAAIAAMRDPTEAMEKAGERAVNSCLSGDVGEEGTLEADPWVPVWHAMIDAALAQTATDPETPVPLSPANLRKV